MQRLDVYCARVLASRTKAQEAISNGYVRVNGKKAYKNAMLLCDDDEVHIDTHGLLIGRAGYKLKAFIALLEDLHIWSSDYLKNKRVLDVGASVGGFTQVLLEKNIGEIVCVDVGKNQLHQSIKEDKRVQVFESCDIRAFSDKKGFDLLVCDVSFISLYKLIESFKNLACSDYIWLFKPQFEVGKEVKRDKKGVLKDRALATKALEQFCQHIQNDFRILCVKESAIKGKEGNEEFFIYATI